MTDDPRIADLVKQFTPEGVSGTPPIGYGNEFLFMVGRDDVHGVLNYLIPKEKLCLKFNMFGYDDQELNDDIMALFKDPNVHVQASLDRSQAGGVHEKQIIASDQALDAVDFANSFVILESATHQISHTKGGVFVGQGIYFEGSTNLSSSGEGVGISLKAGVNSIKGFKAQNNTLLISTNSVNLSRFSTQLDIEHHIGMQQVIKKG